MKGFSDYIVYVDESGDHGLKAIDPDYPIFSLAFCVFKKSDYINSIAPTLNEFKTKYWGHCDVVLHENDIRKSMTGCLLYTSPSPRDQRGSRMPSSA